MTLKPLFVFIACGAAALTAAAADPLPRAKPESVGVSSARLARIEQTLKADIERGRLPGAVIAIARKGKLVYYEAFGYLDKEARVTMPKDAIFSIASMTKPLVGVGVMTLLEEGRLSLTDPVSRFFPALGKMPAAAMRTDAASGQVLLETVPAKREMTVQDLLRHTSGLTYGGRGSTPVHKLYPASSSTAGRTMTGAEFIDKLGTLPLLYQPGTNWEYGFSIDVLGLIIEAQSGKTLGQYLQERVFKPLRMADTGFSVPPEKAGRYAKPLAIDPDTGKPQTVLDLTTPLKFECGGGCAASTAGDYVRFAQMLLNRGALNGARVLGSKTVDYMTADHLGPEIQNNIERTDPTRAGYGFGLTMAVRRQTGISGIMGSPGDYTWGGAYGTNFWVDPNARLVVVFMAATPGPMRLHYRKVINALALQAITD